jgi:hypothetical protein
MPQSAGMLAPAGFIHKPAGKDAFAARAYLASHIFIDRVTRSEASC